MNTNNSFILRTHILGSIILAIPPLVIASGFFAHADNMTKLITTLVNIISLILLGWIWGSYAKDQAKLKHAQELAALETQLNTVTTAYTRLQAHVNQQDQ
ncbi:GPO family capsid scaffolding protein [Periweissella fabalis]|uniref:GPO family capsid scaffolding protein n=1 Tax=Periweissella fabalis TaxID=1070421 RepID=A0A7X6N3U9_9LACO|nr:GPO family capsid scaffolding protein [Periweissella fabalis]MCM0599099.1 hypothetical protein [Periweissella fabalis]NKZ23378.1 GPO family capsid scaffolding protein [Periweissella fabalis]